MNDSTNVRVIADNIRKLEKMVKEAGSEVPTPGAGDTGKIIKVGSSGYKLATDYATLQYSATEKPTGRKWLNGEDVFEITFTGTTASTISSFNIGTITGIKDLVHLYGEVYDTSGNIHVFERIFAPAINPSTGAVNASIPSESYTSCDYAVTVLFTKTVTETKKTKKK